MNIKKVYYIWGVLYLSIITSCSFVSPIKSSKNEILILPKKRDLKIDSNLDGIETPGNCGHNIPPAGPAAVVIVEAQAAEQVQAQATAIQNSVSRLSGHAMSIKQTDIENLVIAVKAMITLTQTINAPSQAVLTSVQTTTIDVLMLPQVYFLSNIGGEKAIDAQLLTETAKVYRAPLNNKESLLGYDTALDYF